MFYVKEAFFFNCRFTTIALLGYLFLSLQSFRIMQKDIVVCTFLTQATKLWCVSFSKEIFIWFTGFVNSTNMILFWWWVRCRLLFIFKHTKLIPFVSYIQLTAACHWNSEDHRAQMSAADGGGFCRQDWP